MSLSPYGILYTVNMLITGIISRNHASKEVFAETLADAEAFEESNFNQVDEDGLIDDDVNVSSFE